MGYVLTFIIGAAAGIFAMSLANKASKYTTDSEQELWCKRCLDDMRRQKRFSRLFDERR